MAWKHASFLPQRKFCVVSSACKVTATTFCDSEGAVLCDYLDNDDTITGTYSARRSSHCGEREETRKVEPWGVVVFHQDNIYLQCRHVISSSGSH